MTVVDRSLLEANELMRTLTPAEKDSLFGLAIGRSYPAGELIFAENDDAYSVILLLQGRVGVQMDVGNGRKLMVSTVEPGEITAWSGLVPPYQFTASARAVKDCEVAIFRSEDLTPPLRRESALRLSVHAAHRLCGRASASGTPTYNSWGCSAS